jgi:hypothetical protein
MLLDITAKLPSIMIQGIMKKARITRTRRMVTRRMLDTMLTRQASTMRMSMAA